MANTIIKNNQSNLEKKIILVILKLHWQVLTK